LLSRRSILSKDRQQKERMVELADEVGENTNLEVVRVQYLKEHGRQILRVTINKEGGITLNDCERFSREYSNLLDQEDLIEERYYLEVESPGI
jgi:ribosome maturation factor RimP